MFSSSSGCSVGPPQATVGPGCRCAVKIATSVGLAAARRAKAPRQKTKVRRIEALLCVLLFLFWSGPDEHDATFLTAS